METPDITLKPSPSPSSRRKRLIMGASILVIAALFASGITLIVRHLNRPKAISVATLLAKDPAMVGSYRYVSACQALPPSDYKNVFGYDKNNYGTDLDFHAEGSHTKQAQTSSECDTNFGLLTGPNDDPVVADSVGLVILTLDQFAQASQATDIAKQDLTDSDTTTVVIDGISVAIPNDESRTRFTFAYRNIDVTMDVSSSVKVFNPDAELDVTKAYLTQVATKAVPIIKAAIDNPQQSQAPVQSPDLGKRILGGTSATVINACDYDTSADFETVIGQDDTSIVKSSLNVNSIVFAQGVKTASSGRGLVECKRTGYIDTPEPSNTNQADSKSYLTAQNEYSKIISPTEDETIYYFKDTNDAVSNMKAKVAAEAKLYPDLQTTPVAGLGDYAVFARYTFDSRIVDTSGVDPNRLKEYHLITVRGAYGVDISIDYNPGPLAIDRSGTHPGTDAQYRQAAELLFARLPK